MKRLSLSLTIALSIFFHSANSQELVKDINPGGQSSFPTGFVNINGTIFFQARDPQFGHELWKSDGTEAGTVMVKDIRPGTIGAGATQLTNVNGVLFFRADDGVSGPELWKSDGTAEGTVMVKDIRPGSVGSDPFYMTASNGLLFFRATDGISNDNVGTELWKSDGTAAGTVPLKDIIPGISSSQPEFLVDFNGTLFFVVTPPSFSGRELWKSDGTTEGTVSVKAFEERPALLPLRGQFWVVNESLFFIAYDYSSTNTGSELWKTDGTGSGTEFITKIRVGEGGTPEYYAVNGGELYFRGFDDVNGSELWKSDGTAAGTAIVKDIAPGAANSYPYRLHTYNGSVFFSATDEVLGYELWKSDGTESGTVLVKDIFPGIGTSNAGSFVNFNGRLLFHAVDEGGALTQTWRTDGTSAGTVKLTPGISYGLTDSNNQAIVLAVGNTLFYTGNGELWKYVEESNVPAPVISSFTPASGAVGTTVTILGTNFSTTPAENVVKFNSTTATVVGATATALGAIVPPGATSGAITVSVAGQTATSANSFIVTTGPAITGFTPSTGHIGSTVTINGTDFSVVPDENIVAFNGTPAIVTESTSTSITTSVPENATTGPITVTIGSQTATSATDFIIDNSLTITGFSPASGQVGTTVTITGSGFSTIPENNIVLFNDFVQAVVTASTGSSITTTVPVSASTGAVSVHVGSEGATTAESFFVPAPTITGFFPPEGQPGTVVTITGTDFSILPDANLVLFNGEQASILSSTPTTITAVVPAGAASGPIQLAIGIQYAESLESFTVPAATITGFSPTSGPVGTSVTITGSNFSLTPADNWVVFGEGLITTAASSTGTSITVLVPGHATDGPITVVIGNQLMVSDGVFTIVDPTLTGFTPGTGQVGAEVTVHGTGFSPIAEENSVFFNGTQGTVTASTSTSITVMVPGGATSGPITVIIGPHTLTSAEVFVVPAPTITAVTPMTGQVGTSVTILGGDFSVVPSSNIVKFNGTVAVVTASTSTTITTSVPADATSGTVSVTIGDQTATSSESFTVTEPTIPVPAIAGFAPGSGPVGTVVTITGQNFSAVPANNIVTFNNTTAVVLASTATEITTTVPPNATSGIISVLVGNQTATSMESFTVTATPAHSITAFTPVSGQVGTSVTIIGENFSAIPAENVVKFNGTTAVVTASSDITITTSVPAGAASGPISVSIGDQTAMSSESFTVTDPAVPGPVIAGFDPTSGQVGTSVTITGENFHANAANNIVKFNGSTATVLANTANSLVVEVPVDATTGSVTVTVGDQTATGVNNFVVPAPVITSFAPTSVKTGDVVTITGTDFSIVTEYNVVTFNGVAATVSSSTSTTITTTVPAGATTGHIIVSIGAQSASSANSILINAPVITGFTPTSGPVGTAVTISGQNFSTTASGNTVRFNGMIATITGTPTATTLSVTVPQGAGTGKITVDVGEQTATSATDFAVLACAKPPKPVITGSDLNTETPVLTSSSSTGNQWLFNGAPIAGANAASLNVTQAGIYNVRVTVAGGCTSDLSADFVIVVTDAQQPQQDVLRYYPNPVADRLVVEVRQTGQKSMQVFNADGKAMARLQFETSAVEVDVKSYSAGVYYFVVSSASGVVAGRFIKE
jgi:ELWxxDGT repeat protein